MRKTIVIGVAIAFAIGMTPGDAEAGKFLQGLQQRIQTAGKNIQGFLNRNKPENLTPDRKWDGKAYQPVAKPQMKSGADQVQYGQQLLQSAKTAGNARRGWLSGKIANFFLKRQASNGSPQAQLMVGAQERQSAKAGSHPNIAQRTGMRVAGGFHVANGTVREVARQTADAIATTAVTTYNNAVNSKPVQVARTYGQALSVIGQNLGPDHISSFVAKNGRQPVYQQGAGTQQQLGQIMGVLQAANGPIGGGQIAKQLGMSKNQVNAMLRGSGAAKLGSMGGQSGWMLK